MPQLVTPDVVILLILFAIGLALFKAANRPPRE